MLLIFPFETQMAVEKWEEESWLRRQYTKGKEVRYSRVTSGGREKLLPNTKGCRVGLTF